MEVFVLEIEDASHLGGPMGKEYTTHEATKLFESLEAATIYCKKNFEHFDEWNKYDKGWYKDARTRILTVRKQEVIK